MKSDFDPLAPETFDSPHDDYRRLRKECPVAYSEAWGGFWALLKHSDVANAASDYETFITSKQNVVPKVAFTGRRPPLHLDPPEHTRLRRLVAKAFTSRRVSDLRPRVQALVDDLLDQMIAAGPPADLTAALAWPLPITVICEMLGVPVDDRDTFRTWTDQLVALSADDPQVILSARESLDSYLAGLMAQRRAQPTDDLFGALVAARDQGDKLSEEELVAFGVTLLVAGHETTANQIGNFVYLLLSQRERWDRLVAEPELVPSAVEELLRFTPLEATVGFFARIATEDIELGGRTVRAGEAVIVQLASANRDATVFARPDEIDFTRTENPHMAFGHGVHHCVGAPLARLELQVALGTLVRRLPGLRLAVPADEVVFRTNRVMRAVDELPVRW